MYLLRFHPIQRFADTSQVLFDPVLLHLRFNTVSQSVSGLRYLPPTLH